MQNAAKKHANSEVSQFEITSNLLRNLNKFNLTPVTKLVLLELTTHLNEDKNGSVVFPSVNYIADVLGIGLTAAKKAIKDLINEGLIIKSKRSKVKGNYNKYLITTKVRNLTSEPPENECFKKSDSELFMITNKKEQINSTESSEIEILKEYALKRAQNIPAYIKYLQKNGYDKQIIKEYQIAQNNAKVMRNNVLNEIKKLKYAKDHCAKVDKCFFDNVRQKLKG